MSDDFELDDFELDEVTLRQIEEEARRSVEAEFALDTDKLKTVESEEKSLDLDFDLDAETLRQIEREALESVGLDPDTDLDLIANVDEPAADGLPGIDDVIPEIPADVSAGDLLPPSSSGAAVARTAASEKAKAKAKAKHVALAMAHYTAIARRTSMASSSSMVVAADPKDSKTVMLVVGSCLAVLILMTVIVALITNSGRDDGADGSGSDVRAVEQPGTTKDEFAELKRDIRKKTKVMTPANFKTAIERVEAYKAEHPEEAEKCDTELARLRQQLDFVSGGATDP
ncbi:MAG: hypothetical protein QF773_04790 [Lentisphaeria bacterium]|nr:hypothetical protein [Lentisphaeria bacterium]